MNIVLSRLSRKVKAQLAVFAVIAITATGITAVGYMKLPALLFGVGHYTVALQLPESGNLYANGNVTYRGTTVGRVTAVHLTDTGVQADLSLKSDVHIPSDLDAQVHSQTAIGEQYVDLLPRSGTSPPLRQGDVIPRSRASVPPDINSLLDGANRGLEAIPHDDLQTVIDESYTALGGRGPEFSRFVKGSTTLAIDAHKHIDALTALIDGAGPVLDTQSDTSDAIQAWAAHLAGITRQLRTQDVAVAGLLDKGPAAADEARQLLDRLKPTLPILLANLVSVGQVALTYQSGIEQLLVLIPQGVAELTGSIVPNYNTKLPGFNMAFNLNVNVPRTCTTGFLPAQQRRDPSFQDAPDRPAADIYCRIPQDAMYNVRGARNTPCQTRPGKRAPTVKMCESDEQYVPLNDGDAWKGDPNATLSGQDIPQLPPGAPPAQGAPADPRPGAPPPQGAPADPPLVPAIAAAAYDPATGTYVGPNGQVFTRADLAHNAPKEKTWQSMLTPPDN
jgi:phospholipid/cholesterol/gamma-HCH transport system substrate-binding protein